MTLRKVAPSMVGIARKKENSAAATRDEPKIMAPRMVAADREVPGTRARHWKQPMRKAVRRGRSLTSS